MFTQINNFITWFDGVVWGLPLIILILFTGILLTTRLGLLQVRHLGKALKFMVKNEEGGDGEVTSFGALCTALSATIGTGNIVGVATAIAAGGPGDKRTLCEGDAPSPNEENTGRRLAGKCRGKERNGLRNPFKNWLPSSNSIA